MNDEQFEQTMRYFDGIDEGSFARQLRARDTAQREALARVEADLAMKQEAYEVAVGMLHVARSKTKEAQAQLAQAVGLLRYNMESSSFREILTLERDIAAFLARHAQAEQQEAPACHDCNGDGVIPVMEKDHDGNWIEDRCRTCDGSGRRQEAQEAQGAQAGDERAAFERHAAFVGMDFSRAEGHAEYYESPFANGAWEGWKARAAIATQTAVRGAEHE